MSEPEIKEPFELRSPTEPQLGRVCWWDMAATSWCCVSSSWLSSSFFSSSTRSASSRTIRTSACALTSSFLMLSLSFRSSASLMTWISAASLTLSMLCKSFASCSSVPIRLTESLRYCEPLRWRALPWRLRLSISSCRRSCLPLALCSSAVTVATSLLSSRFSWPSLLCCHDAVASQFARSSANRCLTTKSTWWARSISPRAELGWWWWSDDASTFSFASVMTCCIAGAMSSAK
mmetsp:Transcript_3734/g.7902  ORF Transcript_3734/g.7902 Transcript_3734/m.7902 type:complete len:234 (-) Transcript_3734:2390-3091(-)